MKMKRKDIISISNADLLIVRLFNQRERDTKILIEAPTLPFHEETVVFNNQFQRNIENLRSMYKSPKNSNFLSITHNIFPKFEKSLDFF